MKDEKNLKIRLLYSFTIVGSSSFIFFGAQNLYQYDYFLGALEILCGFAGIVNVVYLHFTKKNQISTWVILVILYFALVMIVLKGGVGGTGYLWTYTLPCLSYFLLSKKKAAAFVGLFVMNLVALNFLQSLGVLTISLDELLFRQLIISLIAVSALMYAFSEVYELRVDDISKKKEELLSLQEKLDAEMLKDKDIKESLASEKEALEKNRRAMLNIVEDLDKAKKASEEQTVELRLQKKEIEKFKEAVESTSDHVVITDVDGTILYANPAVEKLTGFSVEEVVGKKVGSHDLWGGLMDKKFYQNLWKTVKIDKKSFRGEITNKKKNGQKYTALTTISPILGDNGEVEFFVGIERDITQEKEIDRMKTDFLSIAAHQLRTPLGSMRWNLDILLSGKAGRLNAEAEDIVKQVQTSDMRMIDLVNDLLDVSRIDQGRVSDNPEQVDINEVIESVIEEQKPFASDKNITVKFESKGTFDKVMIDKNRVRDVFANLVSNSIKYGKEGGFVKVKTAESGKNIIIQIEDNGIGIPEKDTSKLFTKFYRAENAVKSETEGSGLGLFVVKSYLEAWGGGIDLTSAEGKGSTFTITLPKKPRAHVLDKNLKDNPHTIKN